MSAVFRLSQGLANRKIPGTDTDRQSRREDWGVFLLPTSFFARAKKSRSRAAGVRKHLTFLTTRPCRATRALRRSRSLDPRLRGDDGQNVNGFTAFAEGRGPWIPACDAITTQTPTAIQALRLQPRRPVNREGGSTAIHERPIRPHRRIQPRIQRLVDQRMPDRHLQHVRHR